MRGKPRTLRLGQKQDQYIGPAYLAGHPAKSGYSVTALSTETETPGPIVELSAIFFM